MEAGYDYLLARRQFHNNLLRYCGIFFVAVGTALLIISVAYYAYTQQARSNLGNLNYAVPASGVVSQNSINNAGLGVLGAPVNVQNQQVATVATGVQSTVNVQAIPAVQGELAQARVNAGDVFVSSETLPVGPTSDTQQPLLKLPVWAIGQQQLYPGEALSASVWNNPLAYEPSSFIEERIIGQFRPIESHQIAMPGTLSAPTRIIVPSIDVDSEVSPLQIMNLGDSLAYETPKNTVGHIPESVNAGEMGSTWFFGHLESPIMNEGAVFYNLPKIPGLLRNGEEIYVIVESAGDSFLYKMTEAIVVAQDELELNYQVLKDLKPEYAQLEVGGPNLHLVACVPRWDYSRRLVVSGTLVGIH